MSTANHLNCKPNHILKVRRKYIPMPLGCSNRLQSFMCFAVMVIEVHIVHIAKGRLDGQRVAFRSRVRQCATRLD